MWPWIKEWAGVIALAFSLLNLLLNFGLQRWAQTQTTARGEIYNGLIEVRDRAQEVLAGLAQRTPDEQTVAALADAINRVRHAGVRLRSRQDRAEIRILTMDLAYPRPLADTLRIQVAEVVRIQAELNDFMSRLVPDPPPGDVSFRDGIQSRLDVAYANLGQWLAEIPPRSDGLRARLIGRDRLPFRLAWFTRAPRAIGLRVNSWLRRDYDEFS